MTHCSALASLPTPNALHPIFVKTFLGWPTAPRCYNSLNSFLFDGLPAVARFLVFKRLTGCLEATWQVAPWVWRLTCALHALAALSQEPPQTTPPGSGRAGSRSPQGWAWGPVAERLATCVPPVSPVDGAPCSPGSASLNRALGESDSGEGRRPLG